MLVSNKKLVLFLWFVLGAIFVVLNFKHPLNSDEGLILGGAWRLFNGEELYKDFFEFIPPGSFYFIWGAWKLFGPSYWVARLASAILVFGGGVGLYLICRDSFKIKDPLWRFFPVFLFFVFSPFWTLINHNAFSLVFVVWSVYFYLQGLNYKKKALFAWSGLFAGSSVLFLQHRGVALVVAGFIFLTALILKNKEWQWSYLIYYLGFSSLPLFFLLKWPILTIFNNLFIFPVLKYSDVNQVSPVFFFISLSVLAVLLITVRKQLSLAHKFLFTVSFLLLFSVLSRPDLPHLSLVFPFFGVMIASFQDDFFSQDLFTKVVLEAGLCFLLSVSLVFLLSDSTFYSVKNKKFFSYIDKHCPEKHIYAGPFLPGMYFETGKHNPTFYPSFLILNQNPPRLREAKKQLVESRPKCVVLGYPLVEKFGYNRDNPVDNWIEDNYKEVFKEEELKVLQLRN